MRQTASMYLFFQREVVSMVCTVWMLRRAVVGKRKGVREGEAQGFQALSSLPLQRDRDRDRHSHHSACSSPSSSSLNAINIRLQHDKSLTFSSIQASNSQGQRQL